MLSTPATGRRWTLGLAAIAAFAYASWPLGLVLNRPLATSGLASGLEAHSQPYSWLFIALDCLTGACTLVYAVAARGSTARRSGLWVAAGVSYAVFGLATAADALIPFGCGSAPLSTCGADLSHLTSDDYLTALAVMALFGTAVLALVDSVRALSLRPFNLLVAAGVVLWGACGLVFFSAHFSARPPVVLQHVFLSCSGVLAFAAPALLWRTRCLAERRAPPGAPVPATPDTPELDGLPATVTPHLAEEGAGLARR